MTERRARVGIVFCYFGLYDDQIPPGFREDREAAATRCATMLEAHFDTVYAGMLASDSDGPATGLSLSPTGRGWVLARATDEIAEARHDGIGAPNGMFRFDSGIPVLARALGIGEVRV